MSNHTFVIPAYKDSPYLEDCIRHLKAQTVVSDVIITTSTPSNYIQQLADKYSLPYFVNSDNKKGIAGDWNFALSKATTPLVTLAHQDDIYEAEYAEKITAAFDKYLTDEVLIAFTDYRDIVANKIKSSGLNALIKRLLLFPFLFKNKINSRFDKQTLLRFGDPICCPSVTFNKAALGDFEFDSTYTCALDWLAWHRLSQQKGSFLYIDKKLVQHRIHPDSETVNQINSGMRQKEERQIFEMMWGKSMSKIISRIYAWGHKRNL